MSSNSITNTNINNAINEEEVKATSAVLAAASFWIGDACGVVNDMFMACKRQHNDPIKCATAGIAVTHCINDFFAKVAGNCQKEFERYYQCVDVNNQMFMYCREEEEPFTKCALEKLGLRKRLWKGIGPQDGYKDEDDLPGKNSIPYQWHVYQHKRAV